MKMKRSRLRPITRNLIRWGATVEDLMTRHSAVGPSTDASGLFWESSQLPGCNRGNRLEAFPRQATSATVQLHGFMPIGITVLLPPKSGRYVHNRLSISIETMLIQADLHSANKQCQATMVDSGTVCSQCSGYSNEILVVTFRLSSYINADKARVQGLVHQAYGFTLSIGKPIL